MQVARSGLYLRAVIEQRQVVRAEPGVKSAKMQVVMRET